MRFTLSTADETIGYAEVNSLKELNLLHNNIRQGLKLSQAMGPTAFKEFAELSDVTFEEDVDLDGVAFKLLFLEGDEQTACGIPALVVSGDQYVQGVSFVTIETEDAIPWSTGYFGSVQVSLLQLAENKWKVEVCDYADQPFNATFEDKRTARAIYFRLATSEMLSMNTLYEAGLTEDF